MMMTSKRPREKASHVGDERGYEALQSMLTGEYTEESTGARTIRQTGGKDRHSKVFTSRGPRDRRVRLSVATAIRFYDLQDRLGFEQPSKAVEWLLLHCQKSIQALPQLGSQLHLHVQQLAALPLSANPGNHPAPHNIQPMELKPSDQEYILNYRRLQNQRFGQDSLYHTHPLLHNTSHLQLTPLPQLNDIIQAQDSIEEELPQSSGNPSSSGASSDHPIPLSEVSQQHHAGDTGANSRQASMPTDIPPSLLCMSKRRRIQSSSNASHSSLHHYANPDLHAGFVQVDGNEMHTGTMSAIGDRQYRGMETERSWMAAAGTDNAMSNIDCSVISTGAGAVKNDAKPSDNYSLISKIMSSTSNLPTYMNQSSSDFLMSTQGALQGQMNIAGAGMQPNMLSLPSRVEANPYINNIQLMAAKQELLARAQITCAGMSEQTSISPVQVVQGPDLMSGIKYMDDINMQLMSGKNMTANQRSGPNIMYIASDLSPSESNNIGIDLANYAGKPGSSSSSAERQQTRADGAHQQMLYRPSSIWDWTVIKHATLP